jgi:hypothetical protein
VSSSTGISRMPQSLKSPEMCPETGRFSVI